MDTLGLQLRSMRYLPDNQTYVGIINTVSTCNLICKESEQQIAAFLKSCHQALHGVLARVCDYAATWQR